MTEPEKRLWRMLRDRRFQGWKFRRQVPLGPFIADFACFSDRLIVEADGGQHSESIADASRTNWLAAHGWRVLRFWNFEIMQHADNVADRLFAALAHPSPRSPAASRPLPQGERE